jgi:alkyl sulfatase BDS1-like metallo-beta-lactamase superfamily hydrolase
VVIADDIEELTVDGVRMIFQNTPGTEAPAEMNTYFPDWKAFWAAEKTSSPRSTTSTPFGARWCATHSSGHVRSTRPCTCSAWRPR